MMASKKNPIKGVAKKTAKSDVQSPLKPMHQAPIAEPKPHVPGKAEGAHVKPKKSPSKTQGAKRSRNKGR